MTLTTPDPINFAYLGPDQTSGVELVERMLALPPRLVTVDIETVSLKNRSIIGIGIGTAPDEGFYFPMMPNMSPYLAHMIVRVINNPNVTKVYHNALKFDLQELAILGADATNIRDTSVMAWMLGVPLKLSDLALKTVGMEIQEIRDILPKGQNMLSVPYATVARKCIDDCLATYRVHEKMGQYIDEVIFSREMELMPILLKMSRRGIKLDAEVRDRLYGRQRADMDYFKGLCSVEGFNPGSPMQVGYVLASRGNRLPILKEHGKLNGKYKLDTSEEVLSRLDDPYAQVVLAYRASQTLTSRYLKPWATSDRAYARFHLGTATGRLASSDRNLQNIPRGEMRSMFLPDSGRFTDFDYSQQELRVLCHMSGDKEMQYVYEQGLDMHQHTADFMGVDRTTAKNVGFAMVYGATPDRIMKTAGTSSVERAQDLIDLWFSKYTEAADWIQSTKEEGLANRRVKTMGGRWLYLPQPWEESDAGVERKAINYPIQGSAAELTKEALMRIKDLDLVLQVHDEVLIDGFVEREELLRRGLEEVGPFPTPMDVRHLDTWRW